MQLPDFLSHLKETASSPLAFVAYVCVVAAWVYVVVARHRLKTVAKILRDLPENQRTEVILREYSTTPRAGLSSEQWIRTRKQTLFFISFLATLIAGIAIVGITFSRNVGSASNNNNSSTNTKLNSSEKPTADTDIPPLEDPVDVTHPSPSPTPTHSIKLNRNSSSYTPIPKNSIRPVPNLTYARPDPTEPGFIPAAFIASGYSEWGPSEPPPLSNLELFEILEGHSHKEDVRVFDITLANKSNEQKVLKNFEVNWRYLSGGGANIEKPFLLKPSAKYIIVMTMNRRYPQDSKVQCVCPHVVVPPGSRAEPNLVTIRLYLSYRIDYHPYSNWDISFSISITDDKGGKVAIFSDRHWKSRPYTNPY
jgi:hypothetical protein